MILLIARCGSYGRVKGDTRFSFIIIEQWKQGYTLFVSIVSTCYIKSRLIETNTVDLESFKPLKYDHVTPSDLCLTRGKRNGRAEFDFNFDAGFSACVFYLETRGKREFLLQL